MAEPFAAGVAVGPGRPADAWIGLLDGAGILIVIPVLTPAQIRRQFDALELRKMRAMGVG